MAPGPAEHWGPPGECWGWAATGRGAPGPRAGSSAMVSRLHREETDLCVEKGRVSVGKRGGVCRGVPMALRPRPPPVRPPRHTELPPTLPSGSRAAGARAGQGTGRPDPRYLALGYSQFLTREAAWGQKGEQRGQRGRASG